MAGCGVCRRFAGERDRGSPVSDRVYGLSTDSAVVALNAVLVCSRRGLGRAYEPDG
jgi:hypothetical protein